ncbi:hypothetical protein AgCh_016047 [Apium graveolens]
MSTAYHPQMDGQSERTIQTIEDMLCVCAIDFEGRKCRSPTCWDEVGERKILGPELIQQTKEKVELIRKRLVATHNRQLKYADPARKDVDYQEGEYVFLKVSPWKGLKRFGNKGKLKPCYVGPFEILKRVGKVAYELALPPHMQHIHNVFHVSMLKKYNPDTRHVITLDMGLLAATGIVLISTRFVWPYGGRSVYLSGSFTGWTEHFQMSPVEGCPTVFQKICSLPPGFHQIIAVVLDCRYLKLVAHGFAADASTTSMVLDLPKSKGQDPALLAQSREFYKKAAPPPLRLEVQATGTMEEGGDRLGFGPGALAR